MMPTIPQALIQAQSQPQSVPPQATATIEQPPEWLQKLPVGAVLTATVQSRLPSGETVLATAQGLVQVAAEPAPAVGQRVEITLPENRQQGGQMNVTLQNARATASPIVDEVLPNPASRALPTVVSGASVSLVVRSVAPPEPALVQVAVTAAAPPAPTTVVAPPPPPAAPQPAGQSASPISAPQTSTAVTQPAPVQQVPQTPSATSQPAPMSQTPPPVSTAPQPQPAPAPTQPAPAPQTPPPVSTAPQPQPAPAPTQPAPAPQTPPPVSTAPQPQPAPAPTQPAPTPQTPPPVSTAPQPQPAPAPTQPAPAPQTPPPVSTAPQPQPAPAPTQPAPAPQTPPPVSTAPQPQPAPVPTQPAPAPQTPPPVNTAPQPQPAPVSSQPAPVAQEPMLRPLPSVAPVQAPSAQPAATAQSVAQPALSSAVTQAAPATKASPFQPLTADAPTRPVAAAPQATAPQPAPAAPPAAAPAAEPEVPAPQAAVPLAVEAAKPERAAIPSVVGGRLQATIITVTPPGQQPPVPPIVTPRQGQVVQATVVGAANGRPLVSLDGALLSIEGKPLPSGTQVTMLLPPLPTVSAARPAPIAFPTYPSLPAVAETAALLGGQPAAVMAAVIPKLGPQLAAELMVVASAFTRGDLRPLVSDSVRQQIDRAGRTKAASALADEVAEGSKEGAKSPAGDWRMVTLPLHTGQTIEPIKLWLHAAPEADEDGKGQKGGEVQDTRFMIDLTLSKLGPLQIDGLARPGKLELVFRSPTQLPQQIRRELNAVYVHAASAQGIAGGVSFQVAPALKPEIKPAVNRPGVIV